MAQRRAEGGPAMASRDRGRGLRDLLDHACATAAQHDPYDVVRGGREVVGALGVLRRPVR